MYTFALVEAEEIGVTTKGPGQPGLLKICCSVRREAGGIYYGENTFGLYVNDYNGAAFVPFARQSWLYRSPAVDPNVRFRSDGGQGPLATAQRIVSRNR